MVMGMSIEELRREILEIGEPVELKEHFKRMLNEEEKIAVATIKQGWWLAKIVYDRTKEKLKSKGIRWPDLVKAASTIYIHSIAWVKNEISWQELLEKLLETVIVIKKIGGKT